MEITILPKILWEFYNNPPKVSVATPVNYQPFTDQIKIYPNPASDYLIVSPYPDYKFELHIVSTNGQTLLRKMNLTGESRISLVGLPKGAYLIKVISTESTIYKKIILA